MTADTRQWVSFDDPHEQRTWMFDATFLTSSYQCIYGQGCRGIDEVPAPELGRGCCSHGAYLSDDDDFENVSAAAKRLLTATNWQFFDTHRDGEFEDDGESVKTMVVDGACVFLNRPEHGQGPGCALHSAAAAVGEEPADVKPEVCWQVPVRREDHVTETGHLYTMVREWHRRDWGDGGDEFGWWCTDSDEAHIGGVPAYVSLAHELTKMCGSDVYDELVRRLDEHVNGPVWLPHPAVRRNG